MFLLDSLHTPQQRYLSHCYNYSPTNLCSRLALWITISSDCVLSILPSPAVSSDGSRETYRHRSSVEAVVREGKLSYSDAWLTLTSCCDVGEAKQLLTLVFFHQQSWENIRSDSCSAHKSIFLKSQHGKQRYHSCSTAYAGYAPGGIPCSFSQQDRFPNCKMGITIHRRNCYKLFLLLGLLGQ